MTSGDKYRSPGPQVSGDIPKNAPQSSKLEKVRRLVGTQTYRPHQPNFDNHPIPLPIE